MRQLADEGVVVDHRVGAPTPGCAPGNPGPEEAASCSNCEAGRRCDTHRYGLPGRQDADRLTHGLRREGVVLDTVETWQAHHRGAHQDCSSCEPRSSHLTSCPECSSGSACLRHHYGLPGRREAARVHAELSDRGRLTDHAKRRPLPQAEVLGLVGGLEAALDGGVDSIVYRLLEEVGLPTAKVGEACSACDDGLACGLHSYGLKGRTEQQALTRELVEAGVMSVYLPPTAPTNTSSRVPGLVKGAAQGWKCGEVQPLPQPPCRNCRSGAACDEHQYGLPGAACRARVDAELAADSSVLDYRRTRHSRGARGRNRLTLASSTRSCGTDIRTSQISPRDPGFAYEVVQVSDNTGTLTAGADNPDALWLKIDQAPAEYGTNGWNCRKVERNSLGIVISTTDTPIFDHMDLSSTPIVVGDWLVFGVSYQDVDDCIGIYDDAGNPLLDSDGNLLGPPYADCLLGYFIPDLKQRKTPELYVLNSEGGDTEGTLLFDQDACVVYWPHFAGAYMNDPAKTDDGNSILTVLSAVDFSTIAQHTGLDGRDDATVAGADSSGVLTADGYVFGTTNTPGAPCNTDQEDPSIWIDGEHPSCGAIMATTYSSADGTANVDTQLDLYNNLDGNTGEDGFRTWIGGSVSADGSDTLYIGGTNQYGWDTATGQQTHWDTKNRYGCAVTKATISAGLFDGVLNEHAFDPGDVSNCRADPYDPTDPAVGDGFRSAVSGEVTVTSSGEYIWAQYNVNNYSDGETNADGQIMTDTYQAYAVSTDTMTQDCEFVIEPGSSKYRAGRNFQAPTLMGPDYDSVYAHMLYNEPPSPGAKPVNASRLWLLLREYGAYSCLSGGYDQMVGLVYHSPTLVTTDSSDTTPLDSTHILAATNTFLYVFNFWYTAPVLRLPLDHGHDHQASPVFHDGALYLLSRRGDLIILPNPIVGEDSTGAASELSLEGYGDFVWPRFRADNCGSGRPDGVCEELPGPDHRLHVEDFPSDLGRLS